MTQHVSPWGHPQGTSRNGVWTRTPCTVPTRAALKALEPSHAARTEGAELVVASDYARWIYHPTSVAVEVTENLVLVPTAGGPGRWLRIDKEVDLVWAIAFDTADGAPLMIVPPGASLLVQRGYWDVDVAFTGPAASAIGLSASDPAFATKGDLLGGAAGDGAAVLTAPGLRAGTIGTKTWAGTFLAAGMAVRFDHFGGPFTTGSGRAHLVCHVLSNLGV